MISEDRFAPTGIPLIRTYLIAILLIVWATSLALADDPGGQLESESGSVHVQFLPSIPANELSPLAGQISVNVTQLRDLIIAQVNANAAAIKAQDPTWFLPQYYNDNIDKLVKSATDQITNSAAQINTQVTTGLNAAVTAANTALSALSPKILFTDTYQYHKGHRDPGTPGWGTPTLTIIGINNFSNTTSFSISCSVTLSVPGVASFTVNTGMSASVTVGVTASAITPNVASPNSPSTGVSAYPLLAINGTISFSASPGGITVSNSTSVTATTSLPKASGTLTAKQDN